MPPVRKTRIMARSSPKNRRRNHVLVLWGCFVRVQAEFALDIFNPFWHTPPFHRTRFFNEDSPTQSRAFGFAMGRTGHAPLPRLCANDDPGTGNGPGCAGAMEYPSRSVPAKVVATDVAISQERGPTAPGCCFTGRVAGCPQDPRTSDLFSPHCRVR